MNDIPIGPDETLDDLRCGGLKIIQGKKGYRFSLDPLLLCAFTRINAGETVVDLGSGSGVMPLLLAKRTDAKHITGIELQPALADRARRSVLLNGFQERVTIVQRDLREVRNILSPQGCEVVVSNPPYRRTGGGKTAPTDERAMARHELAGGLEDFLSAASYLLKQGGRVYLIHLAERLAELLAAMQQKRLEPKRLRCVHARSGESARMVLVEGRKNGRPGLTVEAPLYVYEGENYSAEVLAIYDP